MKIRGLSLGLMAFVFLAILAICTTAAPTMALVAATAATTLSPSAATIAAHHIVRSAAVAPGAALIDMSIASVAYNMTRLPALLPTETVPPQIQIIQTAIFMEPAAPPAVMPPMMAPPRTMVTSARPPTKSVSFADLASFKCRARPFIVMYQFHIEGRSFPNSTFGPRGEKLKRRIETECAPIKKWKFDLNDAKGNRFTQVEKGQWRIKFHLEQKTGHHARACVSRILHEVSGIPQNPAFTTCQDQFSAWLSLPMDMLFCMTPFRDCKKKVDS